MPNNSTPGSRFFSKKIDELPAMAKKTYEKRSQELQKAIDIAMEVYEKFPPKGFSKEEIAAVIESYGSFKTLIEQADPKFQNLDSLKYMEEAVLTFFHEDSGQTVNEFWQRVRAAGLSFERENKLDQIFAQRRIQTDFEYNYVIDVLGPFEDEGIISTEQADLLEQWLDDFEVQFAREQGND